MNRQKRSKLIVLAISLALCALCVGLCFIDAEPFYGAKIAGIVVLGVWAFSIVPAIAAALARIRPKLAAMGYISGSLLQGAFLLLAALAAPVFAVLFFIK